ncbi:MAG: DUF2309 domain-containing protein [Haloarculaceae archaeon]
MSTEFAIEESIDAAAEAVGAVWPLHSFVAANPLAGLEDRPFHEAVADAERLLGGDGYPSTDVFRRALESGRIDPEVLASRLAEHGYEADPEASLDRLAGRESAAETPATTATERVDAVLSKWLATFLDQGRAEWAMPDREQGFYEAFRSVAPHDGDVPDGAAIAALPDQPAEAIRELLGAYPAGQWRAVFEFHLAALPGWTGFVKQRTEYGGAWQSEQPITLLGYLAIRLALAEQFDAPLVPPESTDEQADTEGDADRPPLPEVWLSAWEATYRAELVDSLTDASAAAAAADDDGRPDAQLTFCIDTRSEIVRRHVEAVGDYETFGYAGFFGVPMRYADHDAGVTVDACPPIVETQHRISDRPATGHDRRGAYDRWRTAAETAGGAVEALESNAATAFSFVENTGLGYGAALAARTLLPTRVYDLFEAVDKRVPDAHEVSELTVEYNPDSVNDLREGLTLEEKVEYAAAAFEQMGWERFARLVVFVGHASQTANNPFDSSLDCGACAGNPGGPNARVLAAICSDEAVQDRLRERGIDVPEDTVFLAGEHNTTTDEIELFDGEAPESHAEDLERLRADLETARAGAAAERADDMDPTADAGVRETERRAADWAETRPEWGLAGNAAFVIGPRDLTDGLDLDGRAFLHSYDWASDPEGDAIESILTGPMVVTQWINAQYYFATVDNAVYGSGSKVTHNPVGNVGVYQGNGGDLMAGLPQQSLMAADDEPYHQPLRLSTVIHAPVDRVADVLADHDDLLALLDNDWLSLTVVDPTQDHRAFGYGGDLEWSPVAEPDATAPAVSSAPSAADD